MIRSLCSILAVTMLAACILVEDFGDAWEKATPDFCVSKIAESLYYAEFNRDLSGVPIEDVARAITLGGNHFLLLKKHPSDAGGRLYRFRVKNGIFERYRLAPTMRVTFEKDYPDAPVSLARDTVTLPKLYDAPLKLLIEIAGKQEYWEVEDKILYNTLRNPTCRFEDRDLKAMEEKAKGKKHS